MGSQDALESVDDEIRLNDFTFSIFLLICAKIMTYDQGKQVHIMTSTLQYAI